MTSIATLKRLRFIATGAKTGVIEDFKYDAKNKLSGDVSSLTRRHASSCLKFLEAIQDAKVIVIGDPDQLASVVGTALADIVKGMQQPGTPRHSIDLSAKYQT